MKRYRLTDRCGEMQVSTEYGDRDSLLAALQGATALTRQGGEPHTYTVEEFEKTPEAFDLITDVEKAAEFLGCDLYEKCVAVPRENYERVAAFNDLLTVCKAWCKALNWEPDWNIDGTNKFYPCYNHANKKMAVDYRVNWQCSPFVFPTAEYARQFGEQFIDLFKQLYGIREKQSFTDK